MSKLFDVKSPVPFEQIEFLCVNLRGNSQVSPLRTGRSRPRSTVFDLSVLHYDLKIKDYIVNSTLIETGTRIISN